MAVQSVRMSLRGYYADGRKVTSDVFVAPLNLTEGDRITEIVCDRGAWHSALLVFSQRRISQYGAESEPHEALASQIRTDLEYLAEWLQRHEPELSRLKATGLKLDVFFDLWIDQDQLELAIPPALLLICGRLGLSIEMITND